MKSNITYTMAFWLIRFWLAARAIGTGLTKFHGFERVLKDVEGLKPDEIQALKDAGEGDLVQTLSFSFYHGLPAKGPMSMESFSASPLMPSFMVGPYAYVLGFALIGLGVALLCGICTRVTLFLMGLLYISLTWGFIILEPTLGPSSAAGIAYLGVHILIIVAGLMLADYNKFELVKCGSFGCCKCCNKE